MKIQICYAKKCEGFVKPVSDALNEFYGVKSFRNALMEPAGTAYNAERKQYDAATLLENLTRVKSAEIALWLVDKDMYYGKMNYVFGYAAANYGAVLSVFRLDGADLVVKEAVHETGHTLGLHHCNNRCVMQYSNSFEEAVIKPLRLCDSCKEVLRVPGVIKID